MKGIGIRNSTLVKNFRRRAIAGHLYPIVSIDFRKHAMTGMMVLGKGYALVFSPFIVRKPSQGMDHPRDYVVEKGIQEELMIQVDISGCPPIPLRPPTFFLSFSLIVTKFTIFGFFWVLNFRSRFETLNNFLLENREM